MDKRLLNFSMNEVKTKKESLIQVNEVSKKDIAIIGMATKLPLANHHDQFWDNLKNGLDCVREFPETRRKDIDDYFTKLKNIDKDHLRYVEMAYLDEIDKFDYKFFGLSPKQASLMDPHQRLFLETTWGAIEDAGYGGNKIVGSRTGVYVGFVGDLHYKSLVEEVEPNLVEVASTGNIASIIASRISYLLDLRGPSILIDTACSASLVAVHYACQGIRNGDCDMAIAGGVRVHLIPLAQGGVDIGIMSSNNRARTFDDSSDGTGVGEGVISILLKPLHKAVKDQDHIYGIIKGTAINQDGSSVGITAPNPEAQEDVIIRAWKDANIEPETIRYIECHGTGTELGDPIEIDGISRAFQKYTDKKQFCAVGSVKTNIGHLDNAAGLAGLVKAVLSLKNKEVPPILYFEQPNRKISFENSSVYVNDMLQNWENEGFPRRCGISAFGLSGTNCHVILEEGPEVKSVSSEKNEPQILALSAKSEQGLQQLVRNYHQVIGSKEKINLNNICYTANSGRGHYEYRLIMLLKDAEDLKAKLNVLTDANFTTMNQPEIYYGHLAGNGEKETSITLETNQKVKELMKKWELEQLVELCQFYIQGAVIDWEQLYKKRTGRKVSLPVYPFEQTRCWLDIPDKVKTHEDFNLSGLLNTENIPEHLAVEIKETLARWQNEIKLEEGKEGSSKEITIQLHGRDNAEYTNIEKQVAQIWGDVLGYKEIGVFDDFYELGGDSIMALTITNHVKKELNVKLEVTELLKRNTLDEFCTYLQEAHLHTQHQINPLEKREYYPVSAAQRRMYFINQIGGMDISYNMPSVMTIEGELDEARIIDIFNRLVQRHEAFRTSFEVVDRQIVQKIHSEVDFDVTIMEATDSEQIRELVTEFIRPFDLSQAPLLRVGLIKESAEKSILMFDMHHIISDGTSISNMVGEFLNLYARNELPELKIQYKDFAAWQNQFFESEEMKKQEQYWLDQFSDDIPVLNLPTDYPRPAKMVFAGGRLKVYMDQELTDGVKRLAFKTGSTLYMVLLTAFNILLSRYSNQEDIVVGSPIAGRKHADIEKLIGMFVNTLAMRNFPKNSKRFNELLAEVKENALQAYENQDYQFEILVENLELERNQSRNPLFDVMFVLQNMEHTQMQSLNLDHLVFTPYQFDIKVSKFDLTLMAMEKEEQIMLSFEYRTGLFKRETIEHLAQHYINIVSEVVENPNIQLSKIQMISDEEKIQLLTDFCGEQKEYQIDQTIHQLFEAQVSRTPENLAVVYGDKSLTYRELNEKSNQLARILREKGVQKDQIVAIMVERSLEMVIGTMAILKAGGAYLPIDSEYPSARIEYMLNDSKTQILLTEQHLKNTVNFTGLMIDIDDQNMYAEDSSNLVHINKPTDLAYTIYTSGTTGRPKGVLLEHRGIANLNSLFKTNFGVDANDRIIQFASCAFDASVWETYMTLLTGATLYILTKDTIGDYRKFKDYLNQKQITIVTLPPIYLENIIPNNIDTLRMVITAGSATNSGLVNKWSNKLKYINAYGPTETSICATVWEAEDNDYSSVPIGKPIDNTQVYIVDQNLNIVPIGVIGELCVSTVGIARGYQNRDELTKEKFIMNPYVAEQKMYRTGDLARWLPDGNIDFLGRVDHQVKIRGYRIELGEIESQLLEYAEIENVIVVAKEDKNMNKFLVAYFTATQELTALKLRTYLSSRLPNYMVPSYIVQLEEMPVNTNGKIDRKRLPEPDEKQTVRTEYVAPRNQLEEKMAQIWSGVLGIERIGIYDNFFELGGHSITAMNVVASAIPYGLNITVQNLFDYPTIHELAEKLTASQEDEKPTEELNLDITVPSYEESWRQIAVANEATGLKNIFLTGVTGYLGAHILAELLVSTDANLFCLVRGEDEEAAKTRLTKIMDCYFDGRYNHLMGERIFVVPGDLAQKQFGLSNDEYADLGEKVDTILHSAALVKHFGDYDLFNKINVLGTQKVISFALRYNIEMNYFSTLSVSGSIAKGDQDIVYTEKDFYVGQNYGDNVYIRSKFEAEFRIFKAMHQGLAGSIYRVGNLTGRYADGHFQQNIGENAFYNYLKSIIELKNISEEMLNTQKFEFTPIDYCSKAIVGLLKRRESVGRVFHIYNHNQLRMANLLPILEKMGIKIDVLPDQEFKGYVNSFVQDQQKSEKLQGLLHSYQFMAEPNSDYKAQVMIDSTLTLNELNQIDFQWPEIDTHYLEKIVAYMKQVQFIA